MNDIDDDDDDDDQDYTRLRTPSKKVKMSSRSAVKSSASKSPRTLQKERRKKLVKKAIEQVTKASKSGVMTRRKRQEIEENQFEQAKQASVSGYESSASDVICVSRSGRRVNREIASDWKGTEDTKSGSEASSYTAKSKKSKKKKKLKKKRISDEDDDMFYLYMSFDESPEKGQKSQVKDDEVGSESHRGRRSRSASVITIATDNGEEKPETPKNKGKAKGINQILYVDGHYKMLCALHNKRKFVELFFNTYIIM